MEAPIKVEAGSGSGYVVINGQSWPKGLVPVTPLGNGQIQLGLREDTICVALFSDYLDYLDVPFATEQAALDHLNGLCFSTGSGVTTDASLLTSGTLAIPRIADGSIPESKLNVTLQAKLNPVINSRNFATGDGVSNDSAGLNAWLAAGNNLYLDAGTYIIGSRILSTSIRNGLKITAHPDAKIVPIAAFNQAHSFLHIENVTNLHIDGLKIEGNAEIATPTITTSGINMSSIDVRACENVIVENCFLTKVVDAGVDARNCVNILVRNNNIPKTTNFAIKIVSSDDVKIIGNKVSGNGFAQHDISSIGRVPGVMVTMSDRVFIDDNYLNDFKDTGTKTEGCDNVTYSNNIVTNVGKDGIKVQEFATENKLSIKNIKIINNIVHFLHPWNSEGSSLITCWNAEKFEISGNQLKGGLRGDADGGQEHGIYINASGVFRSNKGIISDNIIDTVGRSGVWSQNSDYISVHNNQIYNYGLDLENINGIWFETSPIGISIKDNKVLQDARPVSGFGSAIVVGNNAVEFEIEGNTIAFPREYGVRVHVGTSKNVSISSNKITNADLGNITIFGSGTQNVIAIKNNQFLNGGLGAYFVTNGMTITQLVFTGNTQYPATFQTLFNIDGNGAITKFINSQNSTTSVNKGIYGFRPAVEQEGTHTFRGNGSPEGVITANPGSIYLRYDGAASTMLYIKASGNETNTGWIAK